MYKRQVYDHRVLAPASPYMLGFADDLSIPVSRWTEVRRADIPPASGMTILAESARTGLCLLDDPDHRMLHMFNHLEYDTTSLADEYFRDHEAGLAVPVPYRYFPEDNPASRPVNRWRGHAHLLAGNWINQIYQTAPFDPSRIGQPVASVVPAGT